MLSSFSAPVRTYSATGRLPAVHARWGRCSALSGGLSGVLAIAAILGIMAVFVKGRQQA